MNMMMMMMAIAHSKPGPEADSRGGEMLAGHT